MATNLTSIDTVVIVLMENRSFDHMLGYLNLPGPRRVALDGVSQDPAWIERHTNFHEGTAYPPHPFTITEFADPPHESDTIKLQIGNPSTPNGVPPMNGFVDSYMTLKSPPDDPSYVMGYYNERQLPTFDFLARQFSVCDRWFSALPAGTQPNRLMAMSGETTIVDNASGSLPDQPLVYDWLTARGITWCAYQSGIFPFFLLMPKWRTPILSSLALHASDGLFRKMDNFEDAWLNSKKMPQVIFFEPHYTDSGGAIPDDDHPPTSVVYGQDFVARIYNALIANPDRWSRTAMIVTYDEHGGFFDHVPPLPISADILGGEPNRFKSTGVRVPALVVSPFVEPGAVYSGPLDHTSILQFLADRFDAGRPYSDAVSQRQMQLSPLKASLTRTDARSIFESAPSPLGSAELVASTPRPAGMNQAPGASANSFAMHRAALAAAMDRPDLFAAAIGKSTAL